MWDDLNPWLVWGGLVLGASFGVVAQRSRFCIVAAMSNLLLMRDSRQLHAFLAALGVALLGTGFLETLQWVDIDTSRYRAVSLNWLAALLGGLVFGIGAMLAGGCASRTLVRSVEGNLGALVTLMMFALVGMMTLFGVLEPLRGWLRQATSLSLADNQTNLTALFGLPIWLIPLALFLVCGLIILTLGNWRENIRYILAGSLIGLILSVGWWITGVAAQDDFNEIAPSSLAVAGPLARGTTYLITGQLTGSGFALFLLLGLLLGASTSALLNREFRWVAPAGDRVGTYLTGGALMGVGAIFAGGCNIGQGLTGVATLSLQSLLAMTGILLGMWLTLLRMQR
ncbi:MAG: YeeE/YedE family protein [Gammaproteobacteria bacterium]|nr:YeeE/YedE family protein [Gammaproteobacteria bacterium]